MNDVLAQLSRRSMVRLGAYGYALTGSPPAAAELVQAGVARCMARARRPSGTEAVEDAIRREMRALHLGGERRLARWVARDLADEAAPGPSQSFVPMWGRLAPRARAVLSLGLLDGLPAERIERELRAPRDAVDAILGRLRDEPRRAPGLENAIATRAPLKVARR
ncbi:hypothetical protein [Demequina sp. NBRC 110054]|uniref:hypothetical protein n=1 Tax=Demequina sp. NBRC 110054 TaxID=1570343 RepID=UPI0011782893|nr:hypothetical protein [Demequina sp. NBRC 110054]